MPRQTKKAKLREVVAALAGLEAQKVALDNAFVKASREAMKLLGQGSHAFRLDSANIVTVMVLPNDSDYVEVELLDVQPLD